MKPSICSVAIVASAKSARRRHLRLRIENQTSIKLNQDACTGRKWNTNVRCGWASSQPTTSADQCELTGSRIRWIGWGTGGWSGAVGWRTPIPGFSSTQNNGPSVGGLRSNSMMATAFSANSGSRSFIQVSKTVQANLVPLENDADGALAGTAQAKLGMSGHI